ncbi:BTB/POZ domain-containing protein 16 [Aplysia californica]|uniref:BTB/POZ domain-containing protein 16 n=1 Tax=Aplysia californica TaxID=6500 RepID=A0ABM0JB58_APLCA|nr:BTB/POZ domain-containing protein 16 [Aplysia californica]
MADDDTKKPKTVYFPSIPPKVPATALSYSKSVQEAPYRALVGVVVDGKEVERHHESPRYRVRRQTGLTNRWRLPESLYSDLLGSSQALKAINMPFNQSLVEVITHEGPKQSMHIDMSAPYSFRQIDDRPATFPAFATRSRTTLEPGALANPLTVRIKSIPKSVGSVRSFVPKCARPETPKDIFLYHSKKSMTFLGPGKQHKKHDVLLKALGMDWELHRPFLQKSESLTQLLKASEDPKMQKYYRSPVSETLDNYIVKSNFYSNEYQNTNHKLLVVEASEAEETQSKGLDHPAHISEKRVGSLSVIHLHFDDPLVSQRAMAIALGNLYHDDLDVDLSDVAGVLAAAAALGFKQLMEGCGTIMLKSINYRTVCTYHLAASKYHQEHVVLACERWLELNLIPELSMHIQLREMSSELLQKILKSSRLFTYNEYSVYRNLSYWLFLQLNPQMQLMPSHSTVLAYFNSLPKTCSFLETDDGQMYAPLFSTVRLHGIIDTTNIQDMQIMNILPQSWMVRLLSQHYQALQEGGDMTSLKQFNVNAIRQGFIVDDEPHYHSEILSLHGFHFELKAIRQSSENHTYQFYMQRLKPGDPILSFRQCERQTFSMRSDREVQYSITVQYLHKGEHHMESTGVLTHKFGLGEKTSKSQVISLDNLKKPIYVSYALLFPAS